MSAVVDSNGRLVTSAGGMVIYNPLTFSQVLNFANFSAAASSFSMIGAAAIQGDNLNLTSFGTSHEVGAAWYKTAVNVQKFRTDFTFQMLPTPPTIPAINGIAFVIQNSNSTTNPPAQSTNFGLNAGGDANLCGYGGYWANTGGQFPEPFQYSIGNSVCIKFDLNYGNGHSSVYNPLNGGSPNSVGVYADAGPSANLIPENDVNQYGINFYLGHSFSTSIVYDGTLLTVSLTDTTNGAQGRFWWPINIPTIVGGNTALVGFTAGQANGINTTVGANNIFNWAYYTGAAGIGVLSRLSTPTFNVAAGQYTSARTVSISAPAGSTVCYTTNGLAPSSNSTQYSGPITVSTSTLLQAVAVQSGFSDSLVAAAYYQISAITVPTINFPSGFAGAGNLFSLLGISSISGSNLSLMPSIQNASLPNQPTPVGEFVGGAWFVSPVNVAAVGAASPNIFSTTFVFTVQSGRNYADTGFVFVIQNQPPASDWSFNNQPPLTADGVLRWATGGLTAVAPSNGGFGYAGNTGAGAPAPQVAGFARSVAIKFDSSRTNGTGLYTNGADVSQNTVTATGMTFTNGHNFQVIISYVGTTLSLSIQDITSNNTPFTDNFSVNIPSIVGGNTAYVGFTAGSGDANSQQVTSWTWTS